MSLSAVGHQTAPKGGEADSSGKDVGSLNGRKFVPSHGRVAGTVLLIMTIFSLALIVVPMSLWIAGATQGAAGLVLAGKISLGISGGIFGLGALANICTTCGNQNTL